MKKFKYYTTKELEPRPGTKYSTTYYKFSDQETQRLQYHVYTVLVELIRFNDDAILTTPLPGFPRTGGKPNYSCWDIISDMHNQINYHEKDMPSGMWGRWNRLADALDEPWGIDLTHQHQPHERSRPQFEMMFQAE